MTAGPRPGGARGIARLRAPLRDDAGLGLTEVAVAIIVLGIILVGLFPLVVDSLRLAARNAQVAEAGRIVSSQLDGAREEFRPPTVCAPEERAPIAGLPTGFVGFRTVVCAGMLATVTVEVALAADPDPDAAVATAATKVVTGQ